MSQLIPLAQFVKTIETHHRRDVELCKQIAVEGFREFKQEIRKNILAEGPYEESLVDTHAYIDGWKVNITPKGATFWNKMPYARVIEFGRPPGMPMPPKLAILLWVQRKLQLEGHDATRATYFIRHKIAREGTPPHFILRNTLRTFRPLVRARMVEALRARGRVVY